MRDGKIASELEERDAHLTIVKEADTSAGHVASYSRNKATISPQIPPYKRNMRVNK